MAGFTKQQLESLDELFNQKFKQLEDRLFGRSTPSPAPTSAPPSAPAPAPAPCTPAPPDLPQLPPTHAPPPSTDTLKEVEYKQTYKSLLPICEQSVLKTVPTPRDAEVFGNCIAWPPKFGGTDMRLSRDEHLDAWYTTMLNTHHKLIRALPHLA